MVEEHESLLSGQSADCGKGTGIVFAEMLTITSAEPLAEWQNNAFGSFAAAAVKGTGRVNVTISDRPSMSSS